MTELFGVSLRVSLRSGIIKSDSFAKSHALGSGTAQDIVIKHRVGAQGEVFKWAVCYRRLFKLRRIREGSAVQTFQRGAEQLCNLRLQM